MVEPPRHQGTKGSVLDPPNERLDQIAREIVDAAFKVHSALGPGLLESVLDHELRKRGLGVRKQVPVPIIYDGLRLDSGLRLDLVVEDEVVVELKAVERLLPVNEAQILSYLKLSQKRLGILINFNVPRIKEGIRRFAL